MKVFAPLEIADLWFDPQVDHDKGFTTRQERGERFLDTLTEKFRFYILLPLMGIGYLRRKKWAETTYKQRFLKTGPRVAAGVDFAVGATVSIVKTTLKGVRGGIKGILDIPSTVLAVIRNWGVDESELANAIDAFDASDEVEIDPDEDPFEDADTNATLDEALRSDRSGGKPRGRSEPER